MSVRFLVLGPVRVEIAGSDIDLRVGMLRRLLAVLLSRSGEPISVTDLTDALWPYGPPPNAVKTTQVYVHRLRRLLGGSQSIHWGPSGYAVGLVPGELDAHEFATLFTQARDAQHAGDFHAASELFQRALGLWRGEPYAGLEDCLALVPEIHRLNSLRLQVLEDHAEVGLALGNHADLIPQLSAVVDEDPCQERLVGLLMRALYAAGRQADAQDVYWRTRTRLADDLGADPTPQLQELYEAMLRGNLDPPSTASDTARSRPQPHNAVVPAQLPTDVHGFAGRGPELDRLDSLLADAREGRTAVVISAVSGTPGVGKTTLAVHWAHRIRDRFPDGQLYVNLRGFDPTGSIMDPASAIRGLLNALDIAPERIPVDLDAQAALYRSLLDGKRMLVVLDNARDTDQIRPLLPGSPVCLVIVTSRNQLAGLVAKEGARPVTLDLLSDAEARQFLESRLGQDRVTTEPVAVDELVTSCARLPLALAIVAGRAAMHPQLPLGTLADQIRHTQNRLDAFVIDNAEPDVRTVFSWSYQQLTRETRTLFRLLGLHPTTDISAPAAASLAGLAPAHVQPLLDELTRAHLATEHEPGRYRLHDLLCAYATELTHTHDSEGDRNAAIQRMLDHYLHTAHAADRLLYPHRDPITLTAHLPGVTPEELADHGQAMAWFTAERPVLLAAIDQAVDHQLDNHTWQLAWTLSTFLYRRGHWHDRTASGFTALDAALRLDDHPAQVRTHRSLADSHTRLGRFDDAHLHLQQALDLSRELEDHTGEAHLHITFAVTYARQGRHAEALDHAQQALELYRAAGHRDGQAQALNSIGWYYAKLDRHQLALAHCEQALTLVRELGDQYHEAATWDSLGYAHHHLRQFADATSCYQRAIDLYRELGDSYNEADTLTHLGDTQHAVSETAAARRSWQQAQAILDDLDHPDAATVRTKLEDLDES